MERVEDVVGDAFTELMRTSKGKAVRADFRLVRADEQTHSLAWEQQLEGTPFARVLSSSETLVTLQPATASQTSVTLELRQKLSGFFPRFGGFMVRRAAARDARRGARRAGARQWLTAAARGSTRRRCAGGAGAIRHTRLACRAAALGFLADTIGLAATPRPPVALANVRLAPSALDDEALSKLRAIVGERARARRPRRTRAACRRQGLSRPRAHARAASRWARPTRSSVPASSREVARCWSCARASRWRSCRSAAAPASSAASSRCAASTAR